MPAGSGLSDGVYGYHFRTVLLDSQGWAAGGLPQLWNGGSFAFLPVLSVGDLAHRHLGAGAVLNAIAYHAPHLHGAVGHLHRYFYNIRCVHQSLHRTQILG